MSDRTAGHARVACIVCSVLLAGGLCAAAERSIGLEPSAREVKPYERIEFLLRADPVGGNPYDPQQIDLRLEIAAPDGKTLVLPAFFCQPFERRQIQEGRRAAEWMYPVGKPVWKARFAPTQPGAYTCTARLKDLAGEARSPSVTVTCVPGAGKGFVRVSADDPRYFAFDDGSPFFVIGQNVAFVRNVYETEAIFRKMAAQGANYARVWACCEDWAMGVEARKSLWSRSWGWHPPVVAIPGREGYHSDEKCVRIEPDNALQGQPTQRLALRPGLAYRLAGVARIDKGGSLEMDGAGERLTISGTGKWEKFAHDFTTAPNQRWLQGLTFRASGKGAAYLRELSLKEGGDGPELLEEADVNRPVRGWYNQLDAFMLDNVIEAAERHGIYIQLVLFTRDHYMDLLRSDPSADYNEAVARARHFLRYAIARWGASTHVAAWECFNELDPGRPTNRFYTELAGFLDRADPYRHLLATSTWSPSEKDWKLPALDTADQHYYLRPTNGDLYKDVVAAVSQRARHMRAHATAKPALLSEFGMTNDQWQQTKDWDADRGWAHIHFGLWTGAFAGLSGAAVPWFWDEIEKRDMYHHYRPLAAFVADIPFTKAGLRSVAARASDERLRVFALQGKACACAWIYNPEATWWKLGVEKTEPAPVQGASLALEGLEPGRYRAVWWDTWKGQAMAQDEIEAREGRITLAIPAFSRDIACKVMR